MKSVLYPVALAVCLLGCSRGGSGSVTVDTSAFDSAPAAIQQTWQQSQTAAKQGDYLGAATNLLSLQAQSQLSADQRDAVAKSLDLVGNKAFAAAEKGDPAATKAVQAIRDMQRPR